MNDSDVPASADARPADRPGASAGTAPLPESFSQDERDLFEAWQQKQRSLAVILFTDIEGSVSMLERLGTTRYAAVLQRHDECFVQAITDTGTARMMKHTGDGFMALFEDPSDAVRVALRFQWLLAHTEWPGGGRVLARAGIHAGEVLMMPDRPGGPGTVGNPVSLASRVMSIGIGRQILVTRSVFDAARQSVRCVPLVPETDSALNWVAHGSYLLRGIDQPVEVFEVGDSAHAPFQKPADGAGRTRSVSVEDEVTLGWRPAAGLEVPHRPQWRIERKLGEGGFGEVWLATNDSDGSHRVFKFCFDTVRLRSFRRELALFNLISSRLGERDDIARLFGVQLDAAPYFLESEYCEGGVLTEWIAGQAAKDGPVPLETRLDIFVRIARAVGAAHSLGIIHKDVKPSNIFMEAAASGCARPKLADFGIGVVVDRSALGAESLALTQGLTVIDDPSRTGTRLYSAPEYALGKPASVQGDIYSLGVLLYQMVVGDFTRPLGVGWRRDIGDPLLEQDIARAADIEPGRRFGSALQLAEQIESLPARRAALAQAQEMEERERRRLAELAQHQRRMRTARVTATIALSLLAMASFAAWTLHKSRKAALAHAALAEAQRHEIAAQNERAEDQLYVADMVLAASDLIERREASSRMLLERHRPAAGQKDRRGWEWYYARARLDPTQLQIQASTKALRALTLNTSGSEAAATGDDGVVRVFSTRTLAKLREWQASSGTVRDIAWNASGVIATGDAAGEIALWQAASGEQKMRWKAHESGVNAVAWCPVNTRVLTSGGADGTMTLWSVEGRKDLSVTKPGTVHRIQWRESGDEMVVEWTDPARITVGHPSAHGHAAETTLHGPPTPLAWRPGQRQIALAMDGLPLRCWVPDSRNDAFWMWSWFSPGTTSLAWDKSGARLAVGGMEGKIIMLDALALKETRMPLHGHRGAVTGMAWAGSDRLISAGSDGTLRAWDALNNSDEAHALRFDAPVTTAAFSPCAQTLAVLLASNKLQLWDCSVWRLLWSSRLPSPALCGAPGALASLAWKPDGAQIAAACPERGIVIWDAATGRRTSSCLQSDVRQLCWLPGNETPLVFAAHGKAIPGDRTGMLPRCDEHHFLADLQGIGLVSVALEHGRLTLTAVDAAGAETRVATDDRASGELPGELCFATSSTDHRRLAVGTSEGAILWLDAADKRWVRPLVSHTGPLRAGAWAPDGTRLATVGADNLCRIYNVQSASPNWLLMPKTRRSLSAVDWSSDGMRILLASEGEFELTVFDASNGWRLEGHAMPPGTPRLDDEWKQATERLSAAPEAADGWEHLERLLADRSEAGGSAEARDLIQAAARLAQKHRPAPAARWPGTMQAPACEWRGRRLPACVIAAQWAVLQHNDKLLSVCDEACAAKDAAPAPAWFHVMAASALEKLGQPEAARKRWHEAWKKLSIEFGPLPPALSVPVAASGEMDFKAVTSLRPRDEWLPSKDNNLVALPARLSTRDGIRYACDHVLQMAGADLGSLAADHAFPAITPLLELQRPTQHMSFLLGAILAEPGRAAPDVCAGLIFLHHEDGTVSGIPLIMGQNLWHWWTPAKPEHPSAAPADLIAWTGTNAFASYNQRGIALHQLDWHARDGISPVKAISILSWSGPAAPMIAGMSAGSGQ